MKKIVLFLALFSILGTAVMADPRPSPPTSKPTRDKPTNPSSREVAVMAIDAIGGGLIGKLSEPLGWAVVGIEIYSYARTGKSVAELEIENITSSRVKAMMDYVNECGGWYRITGTDATRLMDGTWPRAYEAKKGRAGGSRPIDN